MIELISYSHASDLRTDNSLVNIPMEAHIHKLLNDYIGYNNDRVVGPEVRKGGYTRLILSCKLVKNIILRKFGYVSFPQKVNIKKDI